jgi:hypothetical protein
MRFTPAMDNFYPYNIDMLFVYLFPLNASIWQCLQNSVERSGIYRISTRISTVTVSIIDEFPSHSLQRLKRKLAWPTFRVANAKIA